MRFYPIIGFDKEHNETNEYHVMFYLGNGMIYDCHGSRDGIEGRSARPISEVLENNIKVGIFDYIGEEGSATVDGLIRHLEEDFGEP